MKIYVITENSQSNPNYEFTIGFVKFAFTSWQKADMQMNIIRNKIENGKPLSITLDLGRIQICEYINSVNWL